ncbi:MAG: hypothetical protein PHY42_03250 [Bacilli bacterium]|nr:hypothetical protein [Bacilli bacterium]
MKKTLFIFIASLGFLLISSICAYFLKFVTFEDACDPLMIGCIIFLVNIVFATLAKKYYQLNFLSFAINAIGLGFCIRAWYIFRNFDNSLLIMLAVSVIASLYLWVYHLYSKLPYFNYYPTFWTIIFVILTLVLYIISVVNTGTTFLSTVGYYLIIEVAFLFATGVKAKTYKKLFRNVLLSSFSVIVVAILIALMMLSGDGLDLDLSGVDFSGPSKDKNKKK